MVCVRTTQKQQIHMKLTSYDTVQNLSDLIDGHVRPKPRVRFYLGFGGTVPYPEVQY